MTIDRTKIKLKKIYAVSFGEFGNSAYLALCRVLNQKVVKRQYFSPTSYVDRVRQYCGKSVLGCFDFNELSLPNGIYELREGRPGSTKGVYTYQIIEGGEIVADPSSFQGIISNEKASKYLTDLPTVEPKPSSLEGTKEQVTVAIELRQNFLAKAAIAMERIRDIGDIVIVTADSAIYIQDAQTAHNQNHRFDLVSLQAMQSVIEIAKKQSNAKFWIDLDGVNFESAVAELLQSV